MKVFNALRWLTIAGILFIAALLLIDRWISAQGATDIYTNPMKIPERPVGLVLGTSKYIAHSLNPYYTARIQGAIELFKDKKIKVILASGDNAHRSYNEPVTMQRDLLKADVPRQDIILDYAGFRTLDSIVRAKKVFDLKRFTIITQRFHCERALFIAHKFNIPAICFAVPQPKGSAALRIHIREIFARVKAIMDLYIFHKEPHFLGKPVPIMIPKTFPNLTDHTNNDDSSTTDS